MKIIEDLSCKPLPINKELTLREIYVCPTAIHSHVSSTTKKSSANEDRFDLIDGILDNISKDDDPVLIHGQPGHGKTYGTKILVNANM